MKTAFALALAAGASVASAQTAITSFTGGSPFGIFYGSSTGDVVGFRFTVGGGGVAVTSLGVYGDGAGDGVLDSAHMVGIWRNSDQALMGSVSVDSSGSLVGGFYYAGVTPFNLAPGDYTAGAMYTATDNDSYLSSPSSVTLGADISATNGVFPDTGDLGFVYPGSDSTNLARIGPNCQYRPIPAPGAFAIAGLGGLAAARRRR